MYWEELSSLRRLSLRKATKVQGTENTHRSFARVQDDWRQNLNICQFSLDLFCGKTIYLPVPQCEALIK